MCTATAMRANARRALDVDNLVAGVAQQRGVALHVHVLGTAVGAQLVRHAVLDDGADEEGAHGRCKLVVHCVQRDDLARAAVDGALDVWRKKGQRKGAVE